MSYFHWIPADVWQCGASWMEKVDQWSDLPVAPGSSSWGGLWADTWPLWQEPGGDSREKRNLTEDWGGFFPGVAAAPPPSPPSSAPCHPGSRLQAAGERRRRRGAGLLLELSRTHSTERTAARTQLSSSSAPFRQGIQVFSSLFLFCVSELHPGASGCRNCPWTTTSKGFYQILKVCRL